MKSLFVFCWFVFVSLHLEATKLVLLTSSSLLRGKVTTVSQPKKYSFQLHLDFVKKFGKNPFVKYEVLHIIFSPFHSITIRG